MATRNFFETENHELSPDTGRDQHEMSLESEQAVSRFAERAAAGNDRLSVLLRSKIDRRLTDDEENELTSLFMEDSNTRVDFLAPFRTSEISVGPNDPTQYVVVKELNGCFAGVAFFEDEKGGERRAVVVHQPPDLASEKFFDDFMAALTRQSRGASRVHGVLFASNHREQKTVDIARSCIEGSAQGVPIQVNMLEYGDGTKHGPMGLMLIEVPSVDKGPAKFSAIQVQKKTEKAK